MDIHGWEDTQRVDGSKTHVQDHVWFSTYPFSRKYTEYGAEKVAWLGHYSISATNKKTYWCFTHRVCMKPAEVILVVDRKPLQEISLRSQRQTRAWTSSCCSHHRKASRDEDNPAEKCAQHASDASLGVNARTLRPIWHRLNYKKPKRECRESFDRAVNIPSPCLPESHSC